ncbi:MAG: ATP-binding protein [Porticoccaceae bacterium]
MEKNNDSRHAKVFYQPIEAAIRWSDLMPFEARILQEVTGIHVLGEGPFSRWPTLALNLERLFDGLRNGDLPYGKFGITCDDPTLLENSELTIRHVDLKAWMSRFYPDQKPGFLFDEIERQSHMAITPGTMQILMVDREALKLKNAEMEKNLNFLEDQCRQLRKKANQKKTTEHEISSRSEATYLNIVGGLLTLLLGQSPSGKRYSSFDTTDSIISALMTYYPGRPGLSERTLWSKFKAARQHIDTEPY